MRHRNKKKILSRTSPVRRSLLRNLATSFVLYEKITTTKAKGKLMRSYVEKLITLGKNNDVNTRRRLLRKLYGKKAADKILEVLGPRYKERKGGYTRQITIGPRKGDGAEIVLVEFV